MGINKALDMTFNVSANADAFSKALHDAAARAGLSKTIAGKVVEGFKEAQGKAKGVFAKTVAEAASLGLSSAKVSGFAKNLGKISDEVEKSLKRIFDQDMALRKEGLSKEKRDRLKALQVEEQARYRMLDARLKREAAGSEKILKRRRDAVQEAERLAARTMTEAAEEAGDSLQKAFEDLKSGNVGGVLKGVGKRVGAHAAGLQKNGVAQGGMMGGLQEGLGKLLSGLGPLLIGVGALAVGFAAIVGSVMQSDAAMKALNRTTLESGIAGAELVDQYGRVGATLTGISKGFAESFSFNNIWGTTAKDHLEILGAYAEAGVTFKNMTQGVTDAGKQMEILKQHTAAAITYSKLLGLSTKEISEAMGSYMTDLGFTLEGIEGKFSNITRAAMDSGFSTKRFFNMVLQATSGMSMYNVRLEEAAALLKDLGKILGAKMGGDMLQTLVKGFKDESTLERVKKTMTTGVKYSLDVLREDAIKTSEEFSRKMADLGKTDAGADSKQAINAALDEVMGAGASEMKPEELVKKMGKLSTAEQSKLLARAEAAKNPAMVRMLAELMNKSASFSGNGLGAAQAGRQFAGAGAALDLQLNEVRALLGPLESINMNDIKSRAAWENITGKSGEAALQLFEVGKRFSGRDAVLSEEQTKIRGLAASGKVEEASEMAKAFNDRFGKEYGVVLDDAGDRFKAKLDRTGQLDQTGSVGALGIKMQDTRRDMLLTAGDEMLGGESSKVSEDTLLAQEIASNTTDMAKVLEQGVEWLLSKIYHSIEWIKSFFSDSLNSDQMAVKASAATSEADQLMRFQKEFQQQTRELAQQKRKLRGLPEDEKAAAEADIRDREGRLGKLEANIKVRTGRLADIEGITTEKDLGGLDPLDPASYVAAGTKGTRSRTALISTPHTPGTSVQDAMRGVNPNLDQADYDKAVLRASDNAWSQAMGAIGLGATVRGSDAGLGSMTSDNKATMTEDEPLEKVLGRQYLGEKRDALTLSKKELTAEEKQKQKLAKDITEGIAKNADEAEDRKLAALMAMTGSTGSVEGLISQAHTLRTTGRMPRNLDPSTLIDDPNHPGGPQVRKADVLSRSGFAGVAGTAALNEARKKMPNATAPLANDFIMHVGASGDVKFAQRIDGQDTVAVAAKAGGAIDKASSGGGGGGVTIIQHNYSGMDAVQKGYRSLMAARAF